MDNRLRTIVLLIFVFLLSFFSVGENLYREASFINDQADASTVDAPASFSQNAPIRFQFLLNTNETVIGVVNSLPGGSGSKYNTFGYGGDSHSLEQKMQSIALHYLLRTKAIILSLTTGDIIFPFHYFW